MNIYVTIHWISKPTVEKRLDSSAATEQKRFTNKSLTWKMSRREQITSNLKIGRNNYGMYVSDFSTNDDLKTQEIK